MARLRQRGQRLPPGPLRPWRARHPPTGFPEISPRSIRLQQEGAYRLLGPCWSDCRWSSETRSKASGRTDVWAESIRARFLCQSRFVHIYTGCDEIAIARRSGWLSQEPRPTTTIEDMQKIAENRDGECLSKEYINNDSKLTWQCKDGHQWEASPSRIKLGHWCPSCVRKK